MAYEITAQRDGYRRAGMAHRSTPTVYAEDAFTKAQIAQLEADPRITIKQVPDTALSNPDEKAVAKELLTSNQAAAIAGVNRRRVQKWIEAKRLRTVQRYPKILIDREDLDAFLRDQPTLPGLTEDDLDRLLTTKQVADIAQVHLHTVQKWVADGELRAVRQRPKVLIDQKDLNEFLSRWVPPPRTMAAAHEAATEDHDQQPQLLTARQAAEIAKIHPSRLRIWVKEGRLQAAQDRPLLLIDRTTLEAFLRERARPKKRLTAEWSDEVKVEGDVTDNSIQEDSESFTIQPMLAIETPKDEIWQTLMLTLQRQLKAAEVREARLLDLLDQATQPKTRIPRRLKVGEMPLLHRILNYIKSAGRPLRAWQIQQALKLDKPPYRDLSRLVAKRQIRRLKEGVYAALNRS